MKTLYIRAIKNKKIGEVLTLSINENGIFGANVCFGDNSSETCLRNTKYECSSDLKNWEEINIKSNVTKQRNI